MTKRSKLTTIVVLITILLSILAFVAVHEGRAGSNTVGGELLLLLLPVLAYVTCKNITLSFDVFHTPKEEELDDYNTRIISEPRKINERPSKLTISWSAESAAEDYVE